MPTLPRLPPAYQALIVSESIVDTLTTHPIGTGPFRFVEYRPGDQMTLERNTDYFLPGVPTMDRVILRIIPEFTTMVAALESGAVDVAYDLPPEQVDNLKRSTVAHVDEVQAGRWQGIIWNCEMKPFDDPRVRRAFNKLVDKPALTEIAMSGHATPTLTPIPPFHPYFRKDIPIGGADIPGAKKLLTEAGIAPGWELENVCAGRQSAARAAGHRVPRQCQGRRASTSSCASGSKVAPQDGAIRYAAVQGHD